MTGTFDPELARRLASELPGFASFRIGIAILVLGLLAIAIFAAVPCP